LARPTARATTCVNSKELVTLMASRPRINCMQRGMPSYFGIRLNRPDPNGGFSD